MRSEWGVLGRNGVVVYTVGIIARVLLASAIALLAFFAITPSPAQAAAITVTLRAPDVNARNVAVNSDIVVQFDDNVDPASVNEDTFNVDGSLSGEIAGAYGVVTNTITFNPTADFHVGETVTVTLTIGIDGTASDPLANAVTWQFTVAAPSGDCIFSGPDFGPVGMIPTRWPWGT